MIITYFWVIIFQRGKRHKLLQLKAVVYISTQMCESSTNCEILVSSSTWERLSFTDANSALIACYKEIEDRSAVRNSNTGPTHTNTHHVCALVGIKSEFISLVFKALLSS